VISKLFCIFLVFGALTLQMCQATGVAPEFSNSPLFVHSVSFPDITENSESNIVSKNGEKTQVVYRLVSPTSDPEVNEFRERLSTELVEAIERGEETFEVRFECYEYCEASDNFQSLKLLQIPKDGSLESSPISFYFTPKIDTAAELVPLWFTILRNGITYDRFSIDLCVINELYGGGECSTSSNLNEIKSAISSLSNDPKYQQSSENGGLADVSFEFGGAENGDNLTLRVLVQDAVIAREFRKASFSNLSRTSNTTWEIETGYYDLKSVKNHTNYLYKALSCFTIKENGEFHKYLKSRLLGGCATVANSGGAGGYWGEAKAQSFGSQLKGLSGSLQSKLFPGESSKLLDIILKNAAGRVNTGRPLTISYNFRGERLPLQILHSNDAFESKNPKFLGMIAEVADHSKLNKKNTSQLSQVKISERKNVAYLGFDNRVATDDHHNTIASISKSTINYVRESLPQQTKHSATMFEPIDFVKYLKENGDDLDMIFVYSHGDSRGWNLGEKIDRFEADDGSQKLITLRTDSGVESITPDSLEQLTFNTTSLPLKNTPLVILMACETNSPTLGATNNDSFLEKFRSLGAGAIITTEAEIPTTTAQIFSTTMLKYLSDKSYGSLSSAFLDTRRAMYFGNSEGRTDSNSNYDLAALLLNYNGGLGDQWLIS